jgi:nicotinamide riboside kinase
MKKIACIGTHSVGKSTLCYKLALEYKMLGESVHIIQERVRFSPFPINNQMTIETAIWASTTQIAKELEAAQRGFSVIISDRSPLDTFAYARYFSLDSEDYPDALEDYALEWMHTYDEIFFVRPDIGHTPFNDGIRSTDMDFILMVDHQLDMLVSSIDGLPIKQVTTKEIFHG